MNGGAVALKWAFYSATIAFIVIFFTPLVIGGPGAHQATTCIKFYLLERPVGSQAGPNIKRDEAAPVATNRL